MKPEILETLLLDRALGELSPEVAELLEAHLAGDPDAARQAGGLAVVVEQARQAVAMTRETPRPLALARLQQAQAAWRQRAFLWESARLAACLALGLMLGWYVRPAGVTAVIAATPPAVTPAPVAVTTVPPPAESTPNFWSLARLEAVQQERPPAESRAAIRYRLRWDSPVKMPHLEDNS